MGPRLSDGPRSSTWRRPKAGIRHHGRVQAALPIVIDQANAMTAKLPALVKDMLRAT